MKEMIADAEFPNQTITGMLKLVKQKDILLFSEKI